MRKIVSALIGFYRYVISPIIGPSCRFAPTCSEYAQTAITRFGVIKGGRMSIKRIVSCHPWGKSGYDPVPEENADIKKESAITKE